MKNPKKEAINWRIASIITWCIICALSVIYFNFMLWIILLLFGLMQLFDQFRFDAMKRTKKYLVPEFVVLSWKQLIIEIPAIAYMVSTQINEHNTKDLYIHVTRYANKNDLEFISYDLRVFVFKKITN